jgi:hypothetical protein
MDIRAIQGVAGLYELIDENSQSVLNIDAVKYKLTREVKRQLKSILIQISQALAITGEEGLKDFIEAEVLKQIVKNPKAVEHNLWEVRSPAHGGRIFFIMDDDGNIIVSAVDKNVKDSSAQEKAINRGVNRWEKFLKD